MNRQQRRSKNKGKGEGPLRYLDTPCTLGEASQIAQAVAEDTLEDYHKRVAPLSAAISIQVELIKDILFKAGLVTEEEYKEMYIKLAEEFSIMQQQTISENSIEDGDAEVQMAMSINELEVMTEQKEL